MKKILIALVVAVVVSFAASSPAAAQESVTAATVKVPFQFIVGEHVMPAGEYRITPQAADWSVICVTSIKGTVSAYAPTEGLGESANRENPQVSFKQFDGHYFLQAVAIPGKDGREVRLTKVQADRVLAKLNLLGAEPATPAK